MTENKRAQQGKDCDFCDKGKPEVITEPFTAYGVTVEASFYKCANCDTTWLSGRQESEVDMRIKRSLQSELRQLKFHQAEYHADNLKKRDQDSAAIFDLQDENQLLKKKLELLTEQRRIASQSAMCSETTRERWIAECDSALSALTNSKGE